MLSATIILEAVWKCLYPRCAGLVVHKDSVVARIRCVSEPVHDEVKTFATTTSALLELNEFLSAQGVTHVAMEATGVYWKPVWHLLEGDHLTEMSRKQLTASCPGKHCDKIAVVNMKRHSCRAQGTTKIAVIRRVGAFATTPTITAYR